MAGVSPIIHKSSFFNFLPSFSLHKLKFICIRRLGRHRKNRLNTGALLYIILQILSLTLFEKTPIDQLVKNNKGANNHVAK